MNRSAGPSDAAGVAMPLDGVRIDCAGDHHAYQDKRSGRCLASSGTSDGISGTSLNQMPRNLYRAGRRSSIVTSLPVVPVSRHSVRIRVSASVRTPKPTPPITTPTPGAGRSSTILHRFVEGS